MRPDPGLAGASGLEALVYAGSYGLTPAAGPAHPAGPARSQARDVAWPVRSGLVPPLADGFIARPESVPGLEAALVPGAVVALVSGRSSASAPDWPGSCGKTQLAAGLAGSLWQSRTVGLLAWVTAASRASILSGYAQAAAQLGLDHGRDAESVAARFLAWLDGAARPWLVVLDDLRDAADLDGLWPAGTAGRVLITAADSAAVPGEHEVMVCPVPAFSIREALGYLSGRLTTDPDQRSGAIDLVTELACDPAALVQASAVIISSGVRCREYRDYVVQHRAQVTAADAAPLPGAAITWTLSAGYAGQLAPGAGIWPLLALAALLDGHAIPGTVFTTPAACQYLAGQDAARLPDPRLAWSGVLALERAGLVAIDQASTPPAVWVSPALQAAVRAAAPPDLLDQAVTAAAEALLQAWPQDQPRSWPTAALRSCAASLRRAAGDALWAGDTRPRLLLATGRSLEDAGQAGPALAWWQELAADSQRILGPAHPDTLAAAGQLAAALMAAGQAAEAVTWSGWLRSSRASMLGPDHPATIAAQVSLGRALTAAGQPDQALAALNEAAARSELACGPGDAGTVAAREEYAAALLAAGKTGEAIRLYKRLLADRENLHRPGHPGTMTIRLRLAGALLAAGKTKDAIAQHKTVLADREHALGPDHPDTLAARASLAAACDAAGQMGAALQHHHEACAGYEHVYGADHPDTLARRADLARAYSAAGQAGEAVTLLRDTIARSEQALSPGDPLTHELRQALADITGELTAQ
jgi:tetratricopeptide (TPR) repeat protein